jgi:predicted dinucleotide-binding enzyme
MDDMKNIAILGKGNVGSALARGVSRLGLEPRVVGNDAQAVASAVRWADTVIVAVPFGAIDQVIAAAGDFADKLVIDVTNALDANMQLAVGHTTSGAEELQKKLPKARVVKAFHGVLAQHMETGHVDGKQLSTFIAADDAEARTSVLSLASRLGYDAVDAGPLKNARLLEPLAYLNIQLGYVLGLGTQIGFKLVR